MIYEDCKNYYCAKCITCLSDEGPCPTCGEVPPEEGWPDLPAPEYPYLGSKLGDRFYVRQFIGKGSSAGVYRVYSTHNGRSLAAKVVQLCEEGDEEFGETRGRMEMEVMTLGRLRNPHVVNVVDVVELPDNAVAVVMDYIPGINLHDYMLNVGRLSVEQTLDIVRQTANGLHEAHLHGIVHRDIKPANIMMEKLPGAGVFVRVVDFGLAFSFLSAERHRGFEGTPLFAAPEQIYSDGIIGHHADIYALGAVMYYCLTGKPPFLAQETFAVLLAHLQQEAPRVSETCPDIPPELNELIARMLAKDPQDRPRDLEQVIRDIDSFSRPSVFQEWADFVPPSLGFRQAVDRTSDLSVSIVKGLNLPTSTVTTPWLSSDASQVFFVDEDDHLSQYSIVEDVQVSASAGISSVTTILTSGSGIFAATQTGDLYRWRTNITDPPTLIVNVDEHVLSMVEPSPGVLLLGTRSGALIRVNTLTKEVKTLLKRKISLQALAKSPTEPRVLFEYSRRRLGMWDYATNSKIALRKLEAAPISITVCRTGRLGAVLDEAGNLEVFTIPYGELVHRETLEAPLSSIAFTEESALLGLSSGGPRLELWKAAFYES